MLSTFKCHIQVVDDLLAIIDDLQRYELIELDKYAMLLTMRCLNG